MSSEISVLIVDDHDIVCAGLRRLLGDEPGITVIGQANSGEDAVQLAKDLKPMVVIMDLKMPGIGGLEATRKMVRNDPAIKVIALTVYGEEPFPTRLLQAGAAGYLTKDSSVVEMLTAIRTVVGGKHYIGSEIAQNLALKNLTEVEGSPIEQLSERELQIMIMITSGWKVQDISDKLFLSPKTVNSYRYRLFDKLGVSSDVELTLLAIRHGVLDTEHH